MTKDEAEAKWIDTTSNWACTCHLSPPCSFCVDGFSLELEEYLELYWDGRDFEEDVPADTPDQAYDRAMDMLK